ncbi:hypothetical protein OC835_008031 [Tilletia horrida]|nr:hypothetical protein OC835_008031 [Tilletia horrida]
MRATSQAPCERALGSIKRGLTAFRFPYGVVARRARADTQLMLARLRLGLETDPMAKAVQEQLTIPISSSHRPLPLVQAQQEEDQLRALHGDEEFGSLALKRYGRYVRDGLIVKVDGNAMYARVIQFVVAASPSGLTAYASVHLLHVSESSATFVVGTWASDITLVDVRAICAVAAALETGQAVYAVQRSSWQYGLVDE